MRTDKWITVELISYIFFPYKKKLCLVMFDHHEKKYTT